MSADRTHSSHPALDPSDAGRPTVSLHLTVNGRDQVVDVPPMRRLLDVLRHDLGLTGSKEGCGEGECGACSVLMDGRPVNSCLVPAVQAEGATITTIEGLGDHGAMHAVQTAFCKTGGAQCGICTPGMVVTAAWLVDKQRGGVLSEPEIRQHLAGNLCRCTGYGHIVEAVVEALHAKAGSHGAGEPSTGGGTP